MDKQKDAGILLKEIVNKNNINLPLSVNEIYSMLLTRGISEKDKSFNSKALGLFDYWYYEYRDKAIVNKKYSEMEFISLDIEKKNLDNYIKVLIPLDSSHLRIGVKIIFDYLNSNHIKYVARLDNRINNQGFYVLLSSVGDSENLINLVNSNDYLKAGLVKPNPFMYSEKGITCSNYTGLNEEFVLSKMIKLYIDRGFPKNASSYVELELFLRFCTDYYNEVLSGDINIGKFLDDMKEEDTYLNDTKVRKYKDVMELIIKSFQSNFTFDHFRFMNRRKSMIDDSNYNLSLNEKKKILDLALQKNFEYDNYKRISEGNRDNIKEIEIISLYNMIKNGNYNVIVDENYRDLVKKTITSDDLNRIVQECYDIFIPIPVSDLSDIEIENYARDYIEKMYQNSKVR